MELSVEKKPVTFGDDIQSRRRKNLENVAFGMSAREQAQSCPKYEIAPQLSLPTLSPCSATKTSHLLFSCFGAELVPISLEVFFKKNSLHEFSAARWILVFLEQCRAGFKAIQHRSPGDLLKILIQS